MGFEQYHEPPDELPKETRTFARMIAPLIGEGEAIAWYEQRMAVETSEACAIIIETLSKQSLRPPETTLRRPRLIMGPNSPQRSPFEPHRLEVFDRSIIR